MSFKSDLDQLEKALQTVKTASKSSEDDSEDFHSADEEDEPTTTRRNQLKRQRTEDEQVIEASYIKYKLEFKQMKILIIDNKDFSFEQQNKSSVSLVFKQECNILTPVDLFFNLDQCVYTNDAKLAAWRLHGNLPLIQLKLSDFKLERILNLAMSIPLPSSSANNSDDVYQEYDSDETELLDLNGNLLIESNDQDTKKNALLSAGGDKLQQTIQVELAFEILKIDFTLTEENVKYFEFISFQVSSFGVFVQAKTYDNLVNVYLSQIECEYGLIKDTNGSNLYVVKSAGSLNSENRNLVDIKVVLTR